MRAPVATFLPSIDSYCGWSQAPRFGSLTNDQRETLGSGEDWPAGV